MPVVQVHHPRIHHHRRCHSPRRRSAPRVTTTLTQPLSHNRSRVTTALASQPLSRHNRSRVTTALASQPLSRHNHSQSFAKICSIFPFSGVIGAAIALTVSRACLLAASVASASLVGCLKPMAYTPSPNITQHTVQPLSAQRCRRYDEVFDASQLASLAKRTLSLASGGSLKGPFKPTTANPLL